MHIYTYIHVRTRTHIHIYAHKHTNCTYETHASTPGTIALQVTCEEPLQTKERAKSRCRPKKTQSNHILHLQCKDLIVTTSCSTNTPPSPSPLPNVPQNSSKLAQLHNGPFRSCRKIGGKAAVHQSCSKQARRNPSPKMIKVTVHEETRGQWNKRPNPAKAQKKSRQCSEQTTSRSSALVRNWFTQFIANPCRWPQRPCPKRDYISAIFPPLYISFAWSTWYKSLSCLNSRFFPQK